MSQLISQPQKPAQAPESPAKVRRKANPRLLIPIGLILVGAVGFSIWYFSSRPRTDALQLSGRIEGYPTNLGAKVGGRIEFVTVREGDRVRKNETIVGLDDAEIQAQLQGANARLSAAQQQEQQARLQIAVAQSQIEEAQFNLQQSQGDARGRIAQAEANVAAAEAQLNQTQAQLIEARSQLELARKERDRFQQLLQAGAITQQQFDQTQATFQTAQATLQSREAAIDAAQKQVSAAQGALVQAQTASLNPNIRNTQLNALRRQLDVARSQLAAAQAEVKNAQASRQQIQAQIADLNVVSPIDGVVLTRSVEPGEVVATGRTLLTLIDPNTVYLRGFIPGGQIANVRIGQRANVFLDSAPDRPLAARVTAIDTQASFTPENIYFREDRVRQVFGVKLSIDDPQGFAKPGMPADGEILTQ
ncbi:secretion protein HlyD family protein [Gloeocapsa sp. PCC 7428]|uniref:HlyD family secretion protein n=1 Tax=Gloeocapsa sp. PCC 7428 TaxID=1173026 RepID=UPI0002A5D533|nr:HlyD family efflux transporter periplasmic adaptor subunit [Gloeocapsa sp. PCC 7428]AFZ31126.1 secretion protein HlyD family protein [Gloeocapsa sp. PCC 7428]